MNRQPLILVTAAAMRDPVGRAFRDAAAIVRGGCLFDVGERPRVERRIEAQRIDIDRVVAMPDRLLVPALVNAHAHLDLTLTPRAEYTGDFIAWLEHVIAHRPTLEKDIAAAVRRGLADSRAAGVGVVGDVAGSIEAAAARLGATDQEPGGGLALAGVSFVECFGTGEGGVDRVLETAGRAASLEPRDGVVIGLSPHAPYSVSLEAYAAAAAFAADRGMPWQTHLAETSAEVRFQKSGTGPFSAMLQRMGRAASPPPGGHPVEALQPLLDAVRAGPVTLLFAARDRTHNHAVVLREVLRERLAEGG